MKEKIYYSITEVSKMTGIKAYVLRYWETEFEELCPRKYRGNRRMYTHKDIETVKTINMLLHRKKYTIKGARQVLKNKKQVKQLKLQFSEEIDKKSIIKELNSILQILKGRTNESYKK